MVIRHLIPAMPDVNIISTNPGLCYSRLGRNIEFKFTLAGITQVAWYMANARSAAAGARTIVWSAVEAPDESCEVSKHLIGIRGIRTMFQQNALAAGEKLPHTLLGARHCIPIGEALLT